MTIQARIAELEQQHRALENKIAESLNIDTLDIEIPVPTPRVYREYKNVSALDVTALANAALIIRFFRLFRGRRTGHNGLVVIISQRYSGNAKISRVCQCFDV